MHFDRVQPYEKNKTTQNNKQEFFSYKLPVARYFQILAEFRTPNIRRLKNSIFLIVPYYLNLYSIYLYRVIAMFFYFSIYKIYWYKDLLYLSETRLN